jgi:hypothetical protein
VSATRLNISRLQAPHHNQRRFPIVARLLAQGLVVVLVVAAGWWVMWNLGSDSLASQREALTVELEPIYMAECPVPTSSLQKSSARGGFGKGRGCTEEGSSHPISSRQPGVGLHAHDRLAQRQSEDKAHPRTSENPPSTHSGE